MSVSTGDVAPGRVRRIERALMDRIDERTLDGAALQHDRSVKAWWRYRGLGVLAALPVHLVTLAFLAGGVALWVTTDGWPWKVVAAVCLLVAVGTRPSLPRLRTGYDALTRAEAPVLFGLLDDIAAALDGPVPDRVEVVPDLTAMSGRDRRRRVLVLGAPFWSALTPQGRVALLTHELGHFAHGDLTDLFVVDGAVQTLSHWYDVGDMGAPDTVYEDDDAFDNDIRFAHLAMWPLRAVTSAYLAVLVRLNGPMARRREHLADRAAVRLAGTRGALDLMDVLISEQRIHAAMQRAALGRERRDLWDAVAEQMREHGPDARARERELADERPSRLDDSHPANHLRVRLVDAQPWTEPTVWRDSAGWAAVDAEIATVLADVTRDAADSFRGR